MTGGDGGLLSYHVTCSLPFIVGNKNDCPEKKIVQTDDAQKFADQIGIQLHETSAKENLNVEEVSHTYTYIHVRRGQMSRLLDN